MGSFIAYATEPGNVAADDNEGHYYTITALSSQHFIYLPAVLRNSTVVSNH